jgi:hypothetical protein
MHIRSFIFATLALLLLGPMAVFAQESVSDVVLTVPPTDVVLEWGDFVSIVLANVAKTDPFWAFVLSAIGFVVLKLPAPLQWFWRMFQLDQLLLKSIDGAINSTAGAVKGKSLNVNVGSEVFAKALQYAIDNGQAALLKWAGGQDGIAQKLVARIPTDETVSGADLITGLTITPRAPMIFSASPPKSTK